MNGCKKKSSLDGALVFGILNKGFSLRINLIDNMERERIELEHFLDEFLSFVVCFHAQFRKNKEIYIESIE